MNKNRLEIIFDYACKNYSELEINKQDKIIKYTIYINDLLFGDDFFNSKEFQYHYVMIKMLI